jgi:hypothetical protein
MSISRGVELSGYFKLSLIQGHQRWKVIPDHGSVFLD